MLTKIEVIVFQRKKKSALFANKTRWCK